MIYDAVTERDIGSLSDSLAHTDLSLDSWLIVARKERVADSARLKTGLI